MKKYLVVIDVEGLLLNGKVKEYFPKYEGTDIFDTEIEAYKFCLNFSKALYKKNDSATFRVRVIKN